jgi:ABC-type bacteriocin/lantibiotic exporter with double-glycine peptidase domain
LDAVDIQENLAGWQSKIGYVPQNIYLSDDSIRRNIAFGLPDNKIDNIKVEDVIEMAQLNGLIESIDGGLDAIIGEHGSMLSGGQRQRIGIARALYNNSEVIILDEGTSALDSDTEEYLMQALNQFKGIKTLIIISHNKNILSGCDRIFLLKNGNLVNLQNH